MGLLHAKRDESASVIKEPLLSPTAREFIDGDLTADQYLSANRRDLDATDLFPESIAHREYFFRVLVIVMSVVFGITAFFLSWARGPAAGVGALGLSASLLAFANLLSRR